MTLELPRLPKFPHGMLKRGAETLTEVWSQANATERFDVEVVDREIRKIRGALSMVNGAVEHLNELSEANKALLSHEIGTILQNLQIFILEDKPMSYHITPDITQDLSVRINSLRDYVHSLYYFVERTETPVEIVTPSQIFDPITQNNMEFFAREKGATLEFENSAESVQVETNQHVIRALTYNAIKNAAERGGATNVLIKVFVESFQLKVEISDNGRGLMKEDPPKSSNWVDIDPPEQIFEYGQTSHSAKNGSGIGVALAPERLAECDGSISVGAHGGLLSHDAIEDGKGGAKFEITLPIAA